MITLPEKISQISGFSSSDSDLFKDSVLALTSSLWIMNVLMATNFLVGLSKRDLSIYSDAKDALVTEMKRLDYNLNDYEVLPVLNDTSPVLLQLKLHQKTDRIVAAVNLNLQHIHKDESMDLDKLYTYILKENTGVCLHIANISNAPAITVKNLLVQIANEMKLVSLSDLLDTYNRPVKSDINSEIEINLKLMNPWVPIDSNLKGIFITSPIFNEYNCPFKLLAIIQNIIFYIDQKCSSETDMTSIDSINLPKLKNKLFGQCFQYIP